MKTRIVIILLGLIVLLGCQKEEDTPIDGTDFIGTYAGVFHHENGNSNDFPYKSFKIHVLDEVTLNMEVVEYIFNSDSSAYASIRYYFKDNSFYPNGNFEVELFDLTFVNGTIEGTDIMGYYFVTGGSQGTISGDKIIEEPE